MCCVLVGFSLSAYLPPGLVLVVQGKVFDMIADEILLSNPDLNPSFMLSLAMFSSTVCKVIAQHLGGAALP